MADHKKTPGLFLIHCRIPSQSAEDKDRFLKWTKLHYRDIASLPVDPVKGQFTHGIAYIAPDTDPKYKHDDSGLGPYFYTCMLDDIAYLHTEPYITMSRALDLESTRPMLEGEVPVGKGGMVFDICDARFAVYEEYDTTSVVGKALFSAKMI